MTSGATPARAWPPSAVPVNRINRINRIISQTDAIDWIMCFGWDLGSFGAAGKIRLKPRLKKIKPRLNYIKFNLCATFMYLLMRNIHTGRFHVGREHDGRLTGSRHHTAPGVGIGAGAPFCQRSGAAGWLPPSGCQ